MTVSVIIPCLNEEQYVAKLLGDVTKQSVKPSEVFVVDCHSTDRTVAVARKLAHRLPLTILQSPYRSAAAARNTGADAACTDYLLFLDADIRIGPEFVERLLSKATIAGADFVSPRLKSEGRNPFDHVIIWGVSSWNHIYHMLIRRHAGGVGGAMLIKKSAHNTIGGYNPKKRQFDDIDYMMKMWKYKISFAYARGAVAIVSNRRFAKQGRVVSVFQGLSDHHFLVRHTVRPILKRLGIKPQWHDLG